MPVPEEPPVVRAPESSRFVSIRRRRCARRATLNSVSPRSLARCVVSAGSLAALTFCGSACLDTLDVPTYRSFPDAVTSDDVSHPMFDASGLDALDANVDAGLDASRADGFHLDGGPPPDRFDDAPLDLIVTHADARETSVTDSITDYVGPAAVSCAVVAASPSAATFVGNTCDGMDLVRLSCNASGRHEVVIRIDGHAGQVWAITLSGGLAYALYLGSMCGALEQSCGSNTASPGGSISDGPFPGTRTDYLIVEAGAGACTPYTITVSLH